ncbi:MAG: preprotein translocase subunit SecE [Micromonosporaceae bacterium]|nr:preprotein translocase subunit SecE [Micromonosporaceae bacterium]
MEEDEVAKRNRSGADAADEFDDDVDRGGADDDDAQRESGGGAAVIQRPRSGLPRFGLGKIGRFVREVVAELRKVIWPTRKELVTYAVVVVFFIAVLMTIIAGFDYGFASAVQWVFGS